MVGKDPINHIDSLKIADMKSCHIGPEISEEQFISENFFFFLVKGKMEGYDGQRHLTMNSGEACVVRKNHLARYSKQKDNDEFEKVFITLDEDFLLDFQKRNPIEKQAGMSEAGAFVGLPKSEIIDNFILSLKPYYSQGGSINDSFSRIKREELLLILFQLKPGLVNALFDFSQPGKIDLKGFMNKNYKFNVSLERFAFLTGRSLSTFKRDFKRIFAETPSRWLIKKRLQEAYFLISNQGQKVSDIYLDLGFEDLSHFSYAFKKQFGVAPSQVVQG